MLKKILWFVSVIALPLAGCDRPQSTESDVQPAATMADENVMMSADFAERAGLFEREMPPGAGGAGPSAFAECDSSPDIQLADVCGRRYPASVHLAWTDCVVGTAGVTTSGTVDVANTISGDCAGDLAIRHVASVALTGQTPLGMMQSNGTVTITGSRSADAPPSAFTLSLDITRTRPTPGGGELSAHATGSLSVAIDRAASPVTRTANGSIQINLGARAVSIDVQNLVRVPPSVCHFPIAGQLSVAAPDGNHVLVFGPDCGQALLDGQTVTLPLGGFGGPPGR